MSTAERSIVVVGAAEHNLKNVSLRVPKDELVVFVGPSGSGKSSLLIDVIVAEGKRRFDLITGGATDRARPKVQRLSGLSAVVQVGAQRTYHGCTTVGYISLTLPLIVRYFRNGTLMSCFCCGEQFSVFSKSRIVQQVGEYASLMHFATSVVATDLAGLRARLGYFLSLGYTRIISGNEIIRLELFLLDLEKDTVPLPSSVELLIDSFDPTRSPRHRVSEVVSLVDSLGGGILVVRDEAGVERGRFAVHPRCPECGTATHDLSDRFIASLRTSCCCNSEKATESFDPSCRQCFGTGLSAAITHRIRDGIPLGLLLNWPIEDILTFVRDQREKLRCSGESADSQLLEALEYKLHSLADLGLGHLALSRNFLTLSRGERQRVSLSVGLGSRTRGVTFVCDEPSAGLHPKDVERLRAVLMQLVVKKNSVLVVDQNPVIIEAAQTVIALGPGSGSCGGEIVSVQEGKERGVSANPSEYSRTIRPLRDLNWIEVRGAQFRNVSIDHVRIPLNRLTVICGVSGAGKSTLVISIIVPELLVRLKGKSYGENSVGDKRNCKDITGWEQLSGIVIPEQRTQKRSSVVIAARVKLLSEIKSLYAATSDARVRGFSAKSFSSKALEGHCLVCRGIGSIFLHQREIPCAKCDGTGLNSELLAVTFKGVSFGHLMKLPLVEVLKLLSHVPKVSRAIAVLVDLGLGYLHLGRSVSSLSSGEFQRLTFASALIHRAQSPRLFVFEEPSLGLGSRESESLLQGLDNLLTAGHTVIAIDHSQSLLQNADYLIELGPGAGAGGGKLIAEGTVAEVRENPRSLIGRYLT